MRSSSFLVLTAIFLEGIASLGIEILTLRQLVPVVGTTIPITSTAIGLFLLFLAVGYYFGGKIDDNFLAHVGKNFVLAGLWSGISLSSVTTALFFENQLPTMIQLWLYLLICMAPPVYWLSQTVPVLSNFFKMNRTGEASGTALFFSTMGSFFGSLLISFILMRYLGVSVTLFIVSISLLIAGIFLNNDKPSTLKVLIWVFAISLSALFNISVATNFFFAQTAYADYNIVRNETGKIFVVNQQGASGVLNNGKSFPYIEMIRKYIDEIGIRHQKILVIGSGGFTLSQLRLGNNINHYKYVDIDPDISRIAVDSGFLSQINGEFIAQDGRAFLRSTKTSGNQYPAIVVDAYTSHVSIPAHLTTTEFHQDILSALSENGVVIYNLVFDPLLKTPFAQNSLGTIQSVFGVCAVNVLNYKEPKSNVIVICSKKTSNMPKQTYTDERNNVSFDLFEAHEKHAR